MVNSTFRQAKVHSSVQLMVQSTKYLCPRGMHESSIERRQWVPVLNGDCVQLLIVYTRAQGPLFLLLQPERKMGGLSRMLTTLRDTSPWPPLRLGMIVQSAAQERFTCSKLKSAVIGTEEVRGPAV